MNNEFLLNIAGNKDYKQAWIGGLPPFQFDIIDIERCTNFRLAPHLHQKYDVVWLYEKKLNIYHKNSWKLVIDECVRLLKETGLLIIRCDQTENFTIPMLKSFIGRNVNIRAGIEYQDNCSIVFKLKRLNFQAYKNTKWTFAILTGGTKDDNVIKFLQSIREQDVQNIHQIIISGPKKKIYDKYHVDYLDLSQFRDDKYAEISAKKNAIASLSKNDNILIAHDRFYLDKHWLDNFDKYGYDFDFVAVKQQFENGVIHPFYAFVYEPILSWTRPTMCQDEQYLFDTSYVNGGLMVFKKHNLLNIGFNDLLFWNEQEDVEISKTFIEHGVVPRINFISTIIAIDDNSARMNDAKSFNILKNGKIHRKNSWGKGINLSPFVIGWYRKQKRLYIIFHKKHHFPFFGIRVRVK